MKTDTINAASRLSGLETALSGTGVTQPSFDLWHARAARSGRHARAIPGFREQDWT